MPSPVDHLGAVQPWIQVGNSMSGMCQFCVYLNRVSRLTIVVVKFGDLAESIVLGTLLNANQHQTSYSTYLNKVTHDEKVAVPSPVLEASQDLASLFRHLDDVVRLLDRLRESLLDHDWFQDSN